jgi:hypothetical protein
VCEEKRPSLRCGKRGSGKRIGEVAAGGDEHGAVKTGPEHGDGARCDRFSGLVAVITIDALDSKSHRDEGVVHPVG